MSGSRVDSLLIPVFGSTDTETLNLCGTGACQRKQPPVIAGDENASSRDQGFVLYVDGAVHERRDCIRWTTGLVPKLEPMVSVTRPVRHIAETKV